MKWVFTVIQMKLSAQVKHAIFKHLTLIGLFLIAIVKISCAQDGKQSKFFEIIRDDSVKFYCNLLYGFTSPECPDFLRYSRVDPNGNFNGQFVDMSEDSAVLATGFYVNGIKHGDFQVFYPDGRIQSKGRYEKNYPVGDWVFYHENGLPERHLKIDGGDTLLILQADEKGNASVIQGKGTFKGPVENANIPGLWATGDIEGGKCSGKWETYFPPNIALKSGRIAVGKEEFVNGALIAGERPSADHKKITYKGFSVFGFFLPHQIVRLERFRYYACNEMYRSSEHPKLKSRYQLDRIMQTVFAEKNRYKYGNFGEKVIIKITIDENGVPGNMAATPRANILAQRLIDQIRSRIRWTPAMKKKVTAPSVTYLTIEYTDVGAVYRYRYSFSEH
jgi:hypothetical protein